MLYTLNEVFHIKRMFRHEDEVWTSVGRSKCDVAGMPTHYLYDGDSTMALRRCPEPFDATGCNKYCRRIPRRDVIHDVVEIKNC